MSREQKTKKLSELIESHNFNVYRRETSGFLELGIPVNQDLVLWETFKDTNTQKEDRDLCLNLILRARKQAQFI